MYEAMRREKDSRVFTEVFGRILPEKSSPQWLL